MDLTTATQYANEFMQLIAAGCDHIQIAGSIRRQKSDVKDIEIVAVERKFDVLGYDFFGNSRVICKTEAEFFTAIGIPFVEARDRNEAAVSEIKRGLKS